MAHDLKALNDKLDKMITDGKLAEAFEEFYAEDVRMQENNDAECVGKAANREREIAAWAMIEKMHGRVLSEAVGGDVTFTEWEIDAKYKGMDQMKMHQVARRQWRDGKIVHERFFHK